MAGKSKANTGSTSRPLDEAELLELHAWCVAHDVTPKRGDRPSERDAALRQWAAVEVADYKPRSPLMSLAVLRGLWREAESSRGVRLEQGRRVRAARLHRVGRESTRSVDLMIAIAEVVGPSDPGVRAPVFAGDPEREPARLAPEVLPALRALRDALRDPSTIERAARAVQALAGELGVLALFGPRAPALGASEAVVSLWCESMSDAWIVAVRDALERATQEIDASADETIDERAEENTRAHRALELLIGLPEGTARGLAKRAK